MALWGKQDALAVTGTSIGVTNADATVTGTGTAFATQIKNGDTLIIEGVKYKVLSVTSATELELATIFGGETATVDVADVKIQQSPKFLNTTEKRNTLGIDVAEATAGGDNVITIAIENGGTGYTEIPNVNITGGGGSSAAATATIGAGNAVTSITVTNVGSSYETVPSVFVDVPRRSIPTADVKTTTESFDYATHGLAAAEAVKYMDGGGTAITGLTDEATYYVSALGLGNNAFRLAATAAAAAGRTALAGVAISGTGGQFTCTATTLAAGDRVVITGTLGGTGSITGYSTGTIYTVSAVTGTSPSVTGFTLTTEAGSALTTTVGTPTGLTYKPYTIVTISGTGNSDQFFDCIDKTTATAIASKGLGSDDNGTTSGAEKVTNPGWVLKTVGTGGRAGRVQYETLVAGRSLITGDAADDLQAPDA